MDGRNDYFVISGLLTLGKTELIIFDRRGARFTIILIMIIHGMVLITIIIHFRMIHISIL